LTEPVPLPQDDHKLASMQEFVARQINQKLDAQSKNAPPAETKPQMGSQQMDTQTFLDVAARLKRAIVHSRTARRKGKMDDNHARGYVIGRMYNIVQYAQDHPGEAIEAEAEAWGKPRRYWNDGAQFIGWENPPGFVKAARDHEDLRTMEEHAHLPRGAAGYGSCRRCGRTLTNPLSVARGIGPECIKKQR